MFVVYCCCCWYIKIGHKNRIRLNISYYRICFISLVCEKLSIFWYKLRVLQMNISHLHTILIFLLSFCWFCKKKMVYEYCVEPSISVQKKCCCDSGNARLFRFSRLVFWTSTIKLKRLPNGKFTIGFESKRTPWQNGQL